jgi:cytochrome P450
VSGYLLPENTFVNVHPLTLSLSPRHFHDPKGFHPERWLSSAKKDTSCPYFNDDRDAVQAFGVGPRSCIGKSLALAELRLILARLVWRFDLEEVDTVAGKMKWDEQRVFTVVERKPFEVGLRQRVELKSTS